MIKVWRAVDTALAPAKAWRVNPAAEGANAERRHPAIRMLPFEAGKMRNGSGRRFTAR